MARILLVDADRSTRELYGEYLRTVGHEVEGMGSRAEAMEALTRERYDAVVTELTLPDGDGLGLLQHVRSSQPFTQVVVTTALDAAEPAVTAVKNGAEEYLVKPVLAQVLGHAVERVLAKRQMLRDHESLRQLTSLVEAGQRMVTAQERTRLVQVACDAFAQQTGASAVSLYGLQPNGGLILLGNKGMGPSSEAMLEDLVVPQLRASSELIFDVQQLPKPYLRGTAFAAVQQDELLGFAVALYERHLSMEEASQGEISGTYLSRNLALALSNMRRFDKMEGLAYVDDLTQLFNRRYLEMILEREIARGKPFGVLLMDVDHFRQVNDTYGHAMGSKLLIELSKLIKKCVRDADAVVRFGADKFVAVFREAQGGPAMRAAERIRQTISDHEFLTAEGIVVHVTVTIGVVLYPEHALDKQGLLDLADKAMYTGKQGARNVVYLSRPQPRPPAEPK